MLTLYLLAFLLLRIPNFYILPFFQNAFVTTQAFSRIAITFLFAVFIFRYFRTKTIHFNKNQLIVISLIIIFFILQTASVLSAQNLPSFASRYKDVLVAFLFFFVSYMFRKKTDRLVPILLAATGFNIVYQSALFFIPEIISPIFRSIVYQRHWDLVSMNLERGRILTDTYDEGIIPLLIYLITQAKTTKLYLIRILTLAGVFTFAFISNFRTRVFMVFSALACVVIQIKRYSLLNFALVAASMILFGYVAATISSTTLGFSFLDRLDTSSKTNTKTLSWRMEQISEAYLMANDNVLGVGLGNYYDNLNPKFKRYYSYNPLIILEQRNANEQVHNVFALIMAESGYVSLFVFIIILVVFAYHDSITIQQDDAVKKAFIFAFWILFLYGLFNPIVPVAYQAFFWGLRGLVL